MIIDSAMQTALNQPDIFPIWLFWITVKDRTTGAPFSVGFHSYVDDETYAVEGQSRTYHASGQVIDWPALQYTVDSGNYYTQNISLSDLSSEVQEALRLYDAKAAPVEIHLALKDPVTHSLIGITRAFKGFVNTITIDDTTASLELVSYAIMGTKKLTKTKSDANQKEIDPTDKGREYAAIAGSTKVFWGQEGGISFEEARINWKKPPKPDFSGNDD